MSSQPGPVLGEPLPVELMNTVWADRHGRHDAIADAAGAATWLSTVAGVDLSVGPDGAGNDFDPRLATRLRRLRDALRRLAADATDDPRPAAASAVPDRALALQILNDTSRSATFWPELSWAEGGEPDAAAHSKQQPAEVAVARLAAAAIELFAGPDRLELRSCTAPGCVLYFVRDHPRREWCSNLCGNRARAARHYRRHKDDQANDDESQS